MRRDVVVPATGCELSADDEARVETFEGAAAVWLTASEPDHSVAVGLTPAEAVRVAFHLITAAQTVDYSAAAEAVRLIRDTGAARSNE